MIKQLPPLLERLKTELPGFLTAAVVHCDDGLSLAELSVQPEIEAGAAAAYLSSIVKSNRKAIKLLAHDETSDDIIISTGQYHFIIRGDEWLGRTKMIMQSFEGELFDIMLKYYPVNTVA